METLPTDMLVEIISYADVAVSIWLLADFPFLWRNEGRILLNRMDANLFPTLNLKRTNKALYKSHVIAYQRWKKNNGYA